MELEEYFKIYPKIDSEEFGDLANFRLNLQLPNSCEKAITLFSLLTSPDDDKVNFQMDWHIHPSTETVVNFEECRDWLDEVHSDLRNIFDVVVTDKTKKLFGKASK